MARRERDGAAVAKSQAFEDAIDDDGESGEIAGTEGTFR